VDKASNDVYDEQGSLSIGSVVCLNCVFEWAATDKVVQLRGRFNINLNVFIESHSHHRGGRLLRSIFELSFPDKFAFGALFEPRVSWWKIIGRPPLSYHHQVAIPATMFKVVKHAI
jgi:hypothetical protein